MSIMEAKNGDRVKIITSDEEIEGILMPRPSILDEDVIVVKLDNGYNIGIDKKNVKKVEVLEKYKKPRAKEVKIIQKKGLPKVSILSTGGTISSKVDYRTGGVSADYTADDFLQMIPELGEVANIKAGKIMEVMSEDMTANEWQKMAKAAKDELSKADGVIITQGTDVLHYSTAALSFFLRNLGKPVVFTAAQRSIDRGSSDAFMNLKCAVMAAARFDGAGVFSCMHGSSDDSYCLLIRGVKVRKMHSSRRDAFRPINEKPIAKIFDDGKIEVINENYEKRDNGKKVKVDDAFEEKVAIVHIYPGMDPGVIDYYIEKGYKGIVLNATALGHVPVSNEKHSLMGPLERAMKKKIPVVVASQTIYGRVHPYVYTNLRKLSIERECIFVEDMLPETAYVKLGWVLGHCTDIEEVKERMLTNVAGEISSRSDYGSFLG